MSNNNDYFKSKEFLAILQEYEDCEEKGMPCIISTDDYANITEYYHTKGLLDKACRAADEALRLYPGMAVPLSCRARLCLIMNNNIAEAEYYANQIEEIYDPEYIYIKAEIMIADNQAEKADEYLEEAVKETDEEEHDDFCFDIACLFADYEHYDIAWKWIKRVVDVSDDDYLELYGRILIGTGKYAEGEKIFNNLLDKNPFSTIYWNNLATSQLKQNNIKDSIQSSEYSIALDPTDENALINKANGLYTLGNFEEALIYYHRYSTLLPDDDYGEMFQGICHLCLNQYEEALNHLLKAESNALPSSPNLLDIYQEIAFTKSKLNDLQGAIQYLEKTDALECNHAEISVIKGHIYLEHGVSDMAQKYFDEAFMQSKSDPEIFFRIAVSFYDNNLFYQAIQMFQLLQSRVNWPELHIYMAACYKELGMKEPFLEHLQIAVEQDPEESRQVLSYMFPQGMDPSDYYSYIQNSK